MIGARATGDWCGFRWFEAEDLTLGAVAEAAPSLFRDRVVTVSAIDSGPLRVGSDEVAAGWRQVGQWAVSPRSPDPVSLPRGEWDEWYVFDADPPNDPPEVFVNYSRFSLRPEPADEWGRARADRFWGQIAAWWPESYLADGARLVCVTRVETAIPELERLFRMPPGRAEPCAAADGGA